eukprot:5368797-Pleurochrysis_carterae.AAC.1
MSAEGFFDFECCKAFAEMLQSNSTLSKLLLYGGFAAEPLQRMQSLRLTRLSVAAEYLQFTVWMSGICRSYIGSLSDVCAAAHRRGVGADNFDVTPGGVGAFAKALPDNTSLTYLNFAGAIAWRHAIAPASADTAPGRTLDLSCNVHTSGRQLSMQRLTEACKCTAFCEARER